MNKIFYTLLLIGFVSCRPASLSERTIIRDTTIYIHLPADTLHDTVVAREGAFSLLNNGYVNSMAWISSGKLFHRLGQPERYLPVTLRQVEKITTGTPPRSPTPPGRERQELTFIQKVQVFLGNVLLIALAGLIVMRFTKMKMM